MKDFHPLVAAWRFIQPLLFGQVHTNKRAIGAHYDIDPTFFLSFLDPQTPCYTQGVYEDQAKRSAPRPCASSNTALRSWD
jgi:cyclopropane-fatty-acyl-phospholipid synthase